MKKITMLAFLISIQLFAQQPTLKDSLLDHMTGSWALQGTIAGQQIFHDIEANWVLGHQYILINEISHEKNPEGKPQYEANVYVGWNQSSSEYVCVWLDVFGGISMESIGRAKPNSSRIPFIFRDSSNADTFHTTFIYNNNTNTWQWLMYNVDKGKLVPFADVTLTKK
jgi:hypothetical protein